MSKLKFTITVIENIDPANFSEYYNGATTIQECAKKQQLWIEEGSCGLDDVIEFGEDVEIKVEAIE